VTTLALVALWAAASHHCKLEQFSVFDFLACTDHQETEAHHETPCETDGCALVESTLYKTEDTQAISSPLPSVFSFLAVSDIHPAAPVARIDFSATVPPDLLVTWQFSLRAALPVRAPSLAS